MLKFVAVIIIHMMLLCLYSVFIDTSLSKHVDMFFYFGLRLRTSEVYAWGSWYVHFSSCLPTIIYVVLLHNAFWSNSNAFSLIYARYTQRGRILAAGNLDLKKLCQATYSAQHQMSWNFMRNFSGIFEEYWSK